MRTLEIMSSASFRDFLRTVCISARTLARSVPLFSVYSKKFVRDTEVVSRTDATDEKSPHPAIRA
jgi:hypothetical protein